MSETVSLDKLQQEHEELSLSYELLQESMADLILRLEDIDWKPLGSLDNPEDIKLETVKGTSETVRPLAVINPLIVRGIAVRTAYIWGNGVELLGAEKYEEFFKQPTVKKWLCSDKAWQEMEKCGSTDGNVFLLARKVQTARGRRRAKNDIQRIPLSQITGTVVTAPDNTEDIWFYERSYKERGFTAEGNPQTQDRRVFYPAIDYDEANGKPATIRVDGRSVTVDYSARIAHHSPNKQVGWKWGVPTLWSVMWWAKAHKEFLETQASLVKAYARFAHKVTTSSTQQNKATAAKMANPASTDPFTGAPNSVGAAFLGNGVNLQTVGKPGGAVDFDSGQPLAGYVAAGLSVPVGELLADASNANRASAETLESSTLKVMKAEQANYKMFFESIFEWLGMDVTVKFPPIDKELMHRAVQALAQASSLHLLSDEEVRKMLVDIFDLETDEDGVPTEDDMKMQLLELRQAAEQAKQAADAAAEQAKMRAQQGPQRGTNAKPETGNPSYGDNDKRDAEGQHQYTQGRNG